MARAWARLVDSALNDGAMVVRATSANGNDVLAYVAGAAHAGLVTGAAGDANHGLNIISGAQVAANGNALAGGFHGQSVGGSDVLVGYGWNGDVNLDGAVNYLDYGVIDNAYLYNNAHGGSQKLTYGDGNLNLDGVINYLDYGMMDNAHLAQIAPHGAMADAAAAGAGDGPAVVVPGVFATAALGKKVESDLAAVTAGEAEVLG